MAAPEANSSSSSADGIIIASASYEERILLWDVKKGKPTRVLQHEGSQVNSMKISPDRKRLVCAGNPQIRLFDLESGRKTPIMRLNGHTQNVVEIEYERKMRFLVSASEDCTVKTWDVRVKGAQREWNTKAEVNAMTLHPNQAEVICGCHDGYIRVIDLPANKVANYVIRTEGDFDVHLRSVAVSPNGEWLVFSIDTGDVFVWRMEKLSAIGLDTSTILKIPAHSATILKCRFSPDGSMLATASADGFIMLWETGTWKEVKTLDGHREWVWDLAWACDGKYILSGGSDMSVILWDIQAGLAAKKFQGHQKAVSAIALNDLIPAPSFSSAPALGSSSADKVLSQGSGQPPTPSESPVGTPETMKKTVSSKRIVVKKIVVDKSDL